jgi:tryptophan halogenase
MTEEMKARKKVVIAGGGTAGWMAAAALSKTFGETIDLTLIESEQIGTIGVGEATIPPLQRYNDIIGITEIDFMKQTKGTFKLGINFENWTKKDHAYFHSFGSTGKDHWTCTFNHFWMSGLARGHNQPYGDYCLELVAAEQNKFAHLPDNSLNYAFHLDSAQYARFLRELSEANGAVRREGKIGEVHLDPETGNIASITMEDGGEVPGDLFIDCTGFRALLIGQALGTDYDDWSHYLPCDSAIAIQTQSVGPPIPYTRSIAHEAGWQWRIPLQHRTGNGIVYCSKYISQDEALQKISDTVEGEKLTDPNFIKFRTGARQKQWVKNCVAVGLSSGFMEPLESTSIHLIQRNILRLIQLMPNSEISQRDIDQFNKQAEWDMETIRDFLILHYVANERTEPFWTHCREMPIPDSLQHKIELFRETGRVFRENEELFAENSWIQVMMGQGIVPKAYHPLADKMSDKELEYFLSEIRSRVAKTVSSLPPHDTYVKQYCPTNDVM